MNRHLPHLLFAAVYLAVTTWVIYVYVDDHARNAGWVSVLLLVVNLAVGIAIPRWWALLLPLALVALSIPAGGPTGDPDVYEDWLLPTWFVVAVYAPFFAILIGAGRLGRWAVGRWL